MRKLSLILIPTGLLFLFPSCSLRPFLLSHKQEREVYETGQVKKLVTERIQKYNSRDIYTVYHRTRTQVMEYYPDSVLKSYTRKITRFGEGGGSCNSRIEIL